MLATRGNFVCHHWESIYWLLSYTLDLWVTYCSKYLKFCEHPYVAKQKKSWMKIRESRFKDYLLKSGINLLEKTQNLIFTSTLIIRSFIVKIH